MDYEREYQNMETMRQKLIDAGEYGVGKFMIPEVIPELSTKKVLTVCYFYYYFSRFNELSLNSHLLYTN